MKKRKSKNEKDIPPVVFEKTDARVGSVCVSKAGHDEGGCFIVIAGIDRDHVYVADGRVRKQTAPKKKKMRHLSMITKLSGPDTEVLRSGGYNDSFLRKAISKVKSEKLT